MKRLFSNAELHDLIAVIINDESRTKSYSIELIRKLINLEDITKEEPE